MTNRMQKSECRVLSDAELDSVGGGNALSKIGNAVVNAARNAEGSDLTGSCSMKGNPKMINRWNCY